MEDARAKEEQLEVSPLSVNVLNTRLVQVRFLTIKTSELPCDVASGHPYGTAAPS